MSGNIKQNESDQGWSNHLQDAKLMDTFTTYVLERNS